jgi:Rrf2 family protein
MLSYKAKYALRAVLALAQDTQDEPVLISTIAEQENIPRKFLELILLELKRRGLIVSRRGRSGGYNLAKPAEEITFGEIIRLIDGPLAAVPCVSKTQYRKCDDCPDEKKCPIRRVMARVRDATAEILDNTSVADALRSGRKSVKRLLAL